MRCLTCHHVMEDGELCQSPAMKPERYCYFHGAYRARRMKMAQARAAGEKICIDLPPLEHMQAVQVALSQVLEAIAAGVIERKDARLLLTGLRLAASNLKAEQGWNGSSRFGFTEWHDTVGSNPHLASDFGLPAGIDLDAPPEQVFPLPETKPGSPPVPRFAGQRRSAADCEITPGVADDYARIGTPEASLELLNITREALAAGFGKKPPKPVPTPSSPKASEAIT